MAHGGCDVNSVDLQQHLFSHSHQTTAPIFYEHYHGRSNCPENWFELVQIALNWLVLVFFNWFELVCIGLNWFELI